MRFLVLMLCAGILGGSITGKNSRNPPPAKAPDPTALVHVELYVSHGPDFTRVATDETIEVIYLRSSPPRTWGVVKANITKEERVCLTQAITSSRLRTFRPRSEWFGRCEAPDTGTILAIKWRNKEVAFAVPPPSLSSKMPEYAREQYAKIILISNAMADLRNSYSQSGKTDIMLESHVAVRKYQKARDHAAGLSLPAKRRGW